MYIYISMRAKNTTKFKPVQIEVKGPILPGSISTAISTCGRPQCRCHQDPDKRHGPYYRWTGFLEGKRTTKTISQEEALQCEAQIKNYRELQKTINDFVVQSLKNAPWTKLQ